MSRKVRAYDFASTTAKRMEEAQWLYAVLRLEHYDVKIVNDSNGNPIHVQVGGRLLMAEDRLFAPKIRWQIHIMSDGIGLLSSDKLPWWKPVGVPHPVTLLPEILRELPPL